MPDSKENLTVCMTRLSVDLNPKDKMDRKSDEQLAKNGRGVRQRKEGDLCVVMGGYPDRNSCRRSAGGHLPR